MKKISSRPAIPVSQPGGKVKKDYGKTILVVAGVALLGWYFFPSIRRFL